MLDPKEYAKQLVEKHFKSDGGHNKVQDDFIWDRAKVHALIDVQNTIDALNMTHESEFSTLDPDFLSPKLKALIEHFNQVKEHIKQL